MRDKKNVRTGLLFISPWIIGLCVFVLYPLIYSVIISMTRYSGMEQPTFVGLQNQPGIVLRQRQLLGRSHGEADPRRVHVPL